ncbi:Gfo/Idh/MocA family protein [Bacteroidota bacterium]
MNQKGMTPLKRRDFIKKTAYGLGGIMAAPAILSSCGKNELINIGHIGVGSNGTSEFYNYFLPLDGSRSVGICDVFEDRRIRGVELAREYYSKNGIVAPECKPYLDFEELLERDDIDAVHINTPDHWHVPLAIKAARAGKHIMLAKPLGLSYPNFLVLQKELADNNVRFHYGTQQRSHRHIQLGIDMIKEGKIGEIERIDVWAPGKFNVESPVCNEVAVPDGFDYEKWTGPAPLNPYCPERVTNVGSWFQYDYSIGFLAGWGAHPLDVLVWGVKDQVMGPYSTRGSGTFWPEGGIYDNILSWDVHYEYESGLKVHFTSDDHSEDLQTHRVNKVEDGTTFYGTKGWISLSRSTAESDNRELLMKLNDFPKNEKGWMKNEGTMGQMFLDVINGRTKETCPLDEAIISDTLSHMADIAIRTQQEITWDPEQGNVVGNAEANALYTRQMREPYTV